MLIQLINSIVKDDNNKDQIWPEMIRILIVHADERQEIDSEGLDPYIADLLKKVGALSPQDYTWNLTYKEKLDLLLYLVDMIHDLDRFRQFLNKRLEDKSALFKQKNDLHQEIKKIEQEKAEAVINFSKNNVEDQAKIVAEINELSEKLLSSTRTESRWIHQRIQDLNRKKNSFDEEIYKFDDLIVRKQKKIEKIVEEYQSLSIKTNMVGQDKDMNEYWFFKDDPSKLYIKLIENNQWMFISEEEKFEQLFESLNVKGIREKKLQETLKKIRISLKMKKVKVNKTPLTEAETAEEGKPTDTEMKDE